MSLECAPLKVVLALNGVLIVNTVMASLGLVRLDSKIFIEKIEQRDFKLMNKIGDISIMESNRSNDV